MVVVVAAVVVVAFIRGEEREGNSDDSRTGGPVCSGRSRVR